MLAVVSMRRLTEEAIMLAWTKALHRAAANYRRDALDAIALLVARTAERDELAAELSQMHAHLEAEIAQRVQYLEASRFEALTRAAVAEARLRKALGEVAA
jgi:hypothetical protein